MKVLTISLNLENDMIRVVTETENSKRDQGIDFDDGVGDCAEKVLKEILGEVALLCWRKHVEKLLQEADVIN